MITVEEKNRCCGCGACKNICQKNCIEMQLDKEGFLYPIINDSKCVECGLCEKVCHIKNSFTKNDSYKCRFYGAFNTSKDIVKDSSSGGIFWLIVQYVIKNDGIVYGVELKDNFNVVHGRADSLDDCVKFRKSKYLESNTQMVYRKAKEDLDKGILVLFSGTPCQVAGLYSYIGNDHDNLLTCEVVCHGVPSKTVFNKYIEELNKKMRDKAVSMCWRDKRLGWGPPNRLSIKFESGKEVISTSLVNPYQRGFLHNLYLRPSCYCCSYAKLPRISDISLADFWGYEGVLSNYSKNEGLSIVIISSNKGQKVFDEIKEFCMVEEVAESYVTKKSRHTHKSPKYNKNRESFFSDFEIMSFKKLSKRYIYPSIFERGFKKLKRVTRKRFSGLQKGHGNTKARNDF